MNLNSGIYFVYNHCAQFIKAYFVCDQQLLFYYVIYVIQNQYHKSTSEN
jgi:hypothetical protein